MNDLIKESVSYLNKKPLRQGGNQSTLSEAKSKYRIRYQTIGAVYHKDKEGKDKIYTSKSAAEDDIRTLRTNFYNPFPEIME